jgi:hypothetical protein
LPESERSRIDEKLPETERNCSDEKLPETENSQQNEFTRPILISELETSRLEHLL